MGAGDSTRGNPLAPRTRLAPAVYECANSPLGVEDLVPRWLAHREVRYREGEEVSANTGEVRNTIDDLFAMFGVGACPLCCGTLERGLVVDSKAGRVHAECNVDSAKWRAWFARKGEEVAK